MSKSLHQFFEKLVSASIEKAIPISGDFELTSRCNLNCRMCYLCHPGNDRDALRRERTANEWINLAKEACKEGMFFLLLTGGEVFIRNDFKEIYEEISLMGVRTRIYTNATLITPEIASWLGRIPPERVEVTLYGASPETYGRVTGHPDAYDRAVRGIDLLLAQGISLKIKTTVLPDNAGDFDTLAGFAERRGIKLGVVNYVFPQRSAFNINAHEDRLSPFELAEYEANVDRHFKKKCYEMIKEPGLDECNPESATEVQKKPEWGQDSAFFCKAGKCGFWVTWDGQMSTCSLIGGTGIYPFETGFITAWNQLREFCGSVPACEECKKCKFRDMCSSCPGRLKAETGFFDQPAQYLCELAKARADLYSHTEIRR